jgi:hypothetical protein
MNNKSFDEKIKAALHNLEVPYDASTWAALEQRLNAPFAEEHPPAVEAVDKAVYPTLEHLEVPYQSAHWDLLANRMAQTARLRRRIWIAKLSEAAIFLLLLMNLDGLLDGETSTKPQNLPQLPASKHLQAQAPSKSRGESRSSSVAYATAGAEASLPAFIAELFENQEMATQIPVSVPLFDPALFDPANVENWTSISAFSGLPTLQTEEVQSNGYLFPAMPLVNAKVPKQHRFYAAAFANFDKNYVSSEGYSTSANGYGGGVAIGYRIGKWGVEAGLSYNRRQYAPKREIEIYGNTVNGFYTSYAQKVEADVVSVPLKVTRRVAQFGQTTAHATAGVTTNFALDKNYQYASTFHPGQSPPNSSASPDQKPKLRKNGQGILENGSLGSNVYASADVGLRVEHPVNRHFAAFVEPAYRLALGNSGIGPVPAKINTFSVQAGVLATL